MEQSEKYIAFLDILGFKDLVTNNSHEDLMHKVQNLLIPIIETALSNGKMKRVQRDGIDISIADVENIKIHSLSISDSIMFWTDDDSLESFIQIVVAVALTLRGGFYCGLPMRGAISMGRLSFFNQSYGHTKNNMHSLLMGEGLVSAYSMENKQEWSGCVVDKKCVEKVLQVAPQLKVDDYWFLSNNAIIKYNTPYKDGQTIEEFVIRWLKEPQHLNGDKVRENFSHHKKNINNDSVERKIQNTIKFLEHCQSLKKVEDEKNNQQ